MSLPQRDLWNSGTSLRGTRTSLVSRRPTSHSLCPPAPQSPALVQVWPPEAPGNGVHSDPVSSATSPALAPDATPVCTPSACRVTAGTRPSPRPPQPPAGLSGTLRGAMRDVTGHEAQRCCPIPIAAAHRRGSSCQASRTAGRADAAWQMGRNTLLGKWKFAI